MNGTMLIAGSCSAAISAICHVKQDYSSRSIHWGATSHPNHVISDTGHRDKIRGQGGIQGNALLRSRIRDIEKLSYKGSYTFNIRETA